MIEETKLSRKKDTSIERIGFLSRFEVTNEEHPLSSGKSSLWNQYFQVLFFSSANFLLLKTSRFLCMVENQQ
jgi:hypothetical protein